MRRWAAGLEYLGTAYHGWQRQGEGISSVQGVFEAAFGKVANHPLTISVAGRTDAGVHALGQVVHFDSDAARSEYAWLLGANRELPPELSVSWVRPVSEEFQARHSAISRRYRYVIHNQRARSALLGGRAAWVALPLTAEAMHRAAQALLGENDFSAYRAAGCQSATPMRNLTAITARRQDSFVVIDVVANAFLHHMVRNIAGTLIEIGLGRQGESWAGELLAARDRRLAPATAPAEGLYFLGPEYPAGFGLPGPATAWFPTRFQD